MGTCPVSVGGRGGRWFALVLLSARAAWAVPAVRATFTSAPLELHLEADGGEGAEWRVFSRGLQEVETSAVIHDPGPLYLPPKAGSPEAAGAELVFFFHDVDGVVGWELVAEFSPAVRGTWKLNGRFSPLGGDIAPQVRIPVAALERGENLLFVRAGGARPTRLYYRHYGAMPVHLRPAAAGWRARVDLANPDGAPLASTDVATAAPRTTMEEIGPDCWASRERLAAAALAIGRNIARSRIARVDSPFRDGFPLVYDVERGAYRLPHWVWAWGPAIQLLLDLRPLAAERDPALAREFERVALTAARRSLDFYVQAPGAPADGLATMRWEPARATPQGYVEYQTASDALFLAGWGWAPAYRVSHDDRFAAAFRRLAAATQRLMATFPVVPQDWVVERQAWTPHTLDESLFGAVGFRAWADLLPDEGYPRQGIAYVASHVAQMGRADEFLERAWLRDRNRALWEPDVKGHGWVVAGYLDGHELASDRGWMQRARQVAAAVMACQRGDGGWAHAFHPPNGDDAVDDKGTAIWSWLLYRLAARTDESVYRDAARRALAWCLCHQVRSDDPACDGALVNVNTMAYVGRRPMTVLYTDTFFALALLEELRRRPTSLSHALEPACN